MLKLPAMFAASVEDSSCLARLRLAWVILAICAAGLPLKGQEVTIDTSMAGRHQVIDGFGTCLSGNEGTNSWWQQLYFDDLGASMVRVDLTPNFRSPFSDNAYNSPTWGNAGPQGFYARAYTNATDYSQTFSGHSVQIAVMGPNIDTNIGYFVFPAAPGAVARAGIMRRLQLGDFKLFGSLWSPAPWVKVMSGNTYGGSSFGMPAKGAPWPFIWLGNFAGGKLDVSGAALTNFDDSAQGGLGPTSALTQFARCTAAYVRGFQRANQVQFYALSIQNELNFEEFYNSTTYPLSAQYIAALKAVRAEFDKYSDLASIKLMGPEDLMGGDPYSLWQYGSRATTVHKNLQYLQNIASDTTAASALSFFCIHGYANDGTTAAGSNPIQWNWWLNGWTNSPGAGIPAQVKGTAGYGKKSWMTETSGEAPAWLWPSNGFPNQGAWSIALKIQQALVAGEQSAWAYWQFTDGNAVGASTLTDATQQTNAPKYVATKHFFRFIRPNFVRVDALITNAPSLDASAYLAPSNAALTVVLVNSASNAVTVQVHVPQLPAALTSFQSFTSDPAALWASNTVPIPGGTAQVSVPGYGVCSLFGQTLTRPMPPAITRVPQSAKMSAGTTVQLSCSATGDAPLAFQWLFNNLPIPGATSTTLTLTNVQPFHAGQYSVEVTNTAGLLISLPASLEVTGQGTVPATTPSISANRVGRALQLSFDANVGRSYSWLVSTNTSSWSIAVSFVSVSTQALWLVQPTALTPGQYFRVSSP
jgi:O-glycosyl hydrolase